MSTEHESPSEHEAELAPLLRDALRARTPPARTEAQHAALEQALKHARPARSRPVRVLLSALACLLPFALVAGWYLAASERVMPIAAPTPSATPTHSDQASAAEAERKAVERAAEEERLRAAEREQEAALSARKAVAASAADSAAAMASSKGKSAGGDAAPAARCTPADRRSDKRSARPAKLSCPPAASGRASGGGCDPNDPLCGL